MPFSLIAAVDKNYGIGKNDTLPWRLPTDLQYYHNTTRGNGKNVVIMGRVTWESIPEKYRPLSRRINIVITRNASYALPPAVEKAASLAEALLVAQKHNPEEIFVIGGAQIFAEAILHPQCKKIYLTEIDAVFDCDTFFPHFNKKIFQEVSESSVHEENRVTFCFVVYEKVG